MFLREGRKKWEKVGKKCFFEWISQAEPRCKCSWGFGPPTREYSVLLGKIQGKSSRPTTHPEILCTNELVRIRRNSEFQGQDSEEVWVSGSGFWGSLSFRVRILGDVGWVCVVLSHFSFWIVYYFTYFVQRVSVGGTRALSRSFGGTSLEFRRF